MIMHFMYLINEKILKFAFWKSLTLGCTDVQCTLHYSEFALIMHFLHLFCQRIFYCSFSLSSSMPNTAPFICQCYMYVCMITIYLYGDIYHFFQNFVFRLSLRDDTEKRSLIFRTCFAGCPRLSTPWDQLSLRARKYNLSMNNLTRWRYAMLKIKLR